jgi:hypothetical protein
MDPIATADPAEPALDLVSASRPGYTLGSDSGFVPDSRPSPALTGIPTASAQWTRGCTALHLCPFPLQPQAPAHLDLVCQWNLLSRTQKLF